MKSLAVAILRTPMAYTSLGYYIFLAVSLLIYYVVPLRRRWIVLLAASIGFYYSVTGGSVTAVIVCGISVLTAYLGGLALESRRSRMVLAAAIAVSSLPLWLERILNFLTSSMHMASLSGLNLIFPVGLSFYTLQIIAYLADVYHGRIRAQRNPARFSLFCTFFPQIIQGPIPRYSQLDEQLAEGHRFEEKTFVRGFMLILWGFFLKLMIADRAGVYVDNIFNAPTEYDGVFILTAGVLYSLQLYTDFLACTTLSQGAALLFGIQLADNFRRPYFAMSVQDFWRRWHISLSTWLRDYIYIPLGGSRRGRLRRYLNLAVTFLVSGIWHGGTLQFLAWSMLHALYLLYEDLVKNARTGLIRLLHIRTDRRAYRLFRRIWTFWWVMLAWIIFRARSLREAIGMIRRIFIWNPWVLTDNSLLGLGLDWKNWVVLAISVLVLLLVSHRQEQGVCLCDEIFRQRLPIRWGIYIAAAWIVWVFGTYGYGFDARAFIYGGF